MSPPSSRARPRLMRAGPKLGSIRAHSRSALIAPAKSPSSRKSDRIIEVREMDERVIGVEGDPVLVELHPQPRGVAARQTLRRLDEIHHAKLPASRPLDDWVNPRYGVFAQVVRCLHGASCLGPRARQAMAQATPARVERRSEARNQGMLARGLRGAGPRPPGCERDRDSNLPRLSAQPRRRFLGGCHAVTRPAPPKRRRPPGCQNPGSRAARPLSGAKVLRGASVCFPGRSDSPTRRSATERPARVVRVAS